MEVQQKNTILDRLNIFRNLMSRTFREMKRHDPLRMAGATAFFTTFALPPILIILFQLFSIFLNRRFVGSNLRAILETTLGENGATVIREISRGFRTLATTWYLAVLGIIFLMFVATTLFTVIKNTFNDIWDIKLKEKTSFLFKMRLRARSLVVIFIAGLLFLVGIGLDSVEAFGSDFVDSIWQGGGHFFKSGMSHLVSVVIVTSWFIILFRYLADARPTWKVSIVGGLLTGILFSIGKVVLAYLMRTSNIGSIYGASGSFVLILLFVFYSSFILYFGASFIKVYAEELHQPLKPISHAYRYQLRKIV